MVAKWPVGTLSINNVSANIVCRGQWLKGRALEVCFVPHSSS